MSSEIKLLVLGASGMVGSGIVRAFESVPAIKLLTPSSNELNLVQQIDVNQYFEKQKPDWVVVAAAKVGGIHANNTFRGEFLYENMMIATNAIHAAYENNVSRLVFLGSSCIYPKFANQPIEECQLLTGSLEPTNEPYAIAKIAGLKLNEYYHQQYGCNFLTLMPTNLYGPNDNYNLSNAHVLPALLRKFHEAKVNGVSQVELWGTGKPLREFLHVDDLAVAVRQSLVDEWKPGYYNIGSDDELSIMELAELIKSIVGYEGSLLWNPEMPDGTPRKKLSCQKAKALGFNATINLEEGIRNLYKSLDWSKIRN